MAVGNLHGVYRFEPRIEWDLLATLVQRIPAYIVMHGGSGTPELERAGKLGVTKINIGTEVLTSCIECLRQEATKPVMQAFEGLMFATVQAQKEAMVARIRCFGAKGKGKQLLRSF